MESFTGQISKAGKNLFIKVLQKDTDRFSRGDTVKVTLINKAKRTPEDVEEILKNPEGIILTGNIDGQAIKIPLSTILRHTPIHTVKKIILEGLK